MSSELARVLPELAIVIGAGALAALLFQALRMPIVLGYLFAGFVIGPHVTGAVTSAGLLGTLSDLGVILLFFTIGLEFSIRTVARVGLPALLTVIVELSATTVVMIGLGRLFGWTSTEALFVGVGVAIASTMLVVKALEGTRLESRTLELVFALMVVEDLISILLLAVLSGVAQGRGVSAGDFAALVGRLAGLFVAMLAGGLLVVPRTIRAIARVGRTEGLLIASLAVCFGMVWIAVHSGFSLAFGAFVGGMLIAESGKGKEIDVLIRPFRDIFAAIFFISVGMTIAPAAVVDHGGAALALALVLIVAKSLSVSLASFLSGHGFSRSVQAGLTLSQIGEYAFIVVSLGTASGAVRGFLLPVVVVASCVTAVTGGWQIRAAPRVAGWINHRLPARFSTFVSFYDSWMGRIRGQQRAGLWSRLRRPLLLLAIDAVVLTAIALGAAAEHERIVEWVSVHANLAPKVAMAIVGVVIVALLAMFALGIARGASRLAWLIATSIIPGANHPRDLGHAPRRALVLTLELAIVLVLGLPVAALIQPLVPGGGVLILGLVLLLALATRRSILDFDAHVHAGSALILEVLARQGSQRPELSEVEALLPGFEGVTPIALGPRAPAIGKSLTDLDLRAKTGVAVLALSRDGGGTSTPSPTELLRAGDVLALAGSPDAIRAARSLLVGY